jgi:hypothetical protein
VVENLTISGIDGQLYLAGGNLEIQSVPEPSTWPSSPSGSLHRRRWKSQANGSHRLDFHPRRLK